MGKKGSSWLRAVKRAFGSPSEDSESKKNIRYRSPSRARGEELSAVKVEKKKGPKEKHKWVFGKSSQCGHHHEKTATGNEVERKEEMGGNVEKHAIAVALASAVVAEAAVVSAHQPSGFNLPSGDAS